MKKLYDAIKKAALPENALPKWILTGVSLYTLLSLSGITPFNLKGETLKEILPFKENIKKVLDEELDKWTNDVTKLLEKYYFPSFIIKK